MTVRPLIAGNWKMNGLADESSAELKALADLLANADTVACDVLICPPATLIYQMAQISKDSVLQIGGQDCHANVSGAHTGDTSAAMLKDAGATYAIVGHSERRTDHGETNAVVKAKAEAAIAAGLIAIVCVGETLEQRESGETLAVITDQVKNSLPVGATAENTVIAYEPVWAIGTGKTPTPEDVAEVHAHMRKDLAGLMSDADGVRLLYGGSVKGSNAAELMALDNVNGALVGGASLKASDFWPIVETGLK
ncbi:triose-phosphate isomerase [Sneathiella sp. P13V-1]|uniref:triose-phosphate isomerase n=1 Tax=Sneathiella sp. P13V-1 TaxID=2697366 RepID=UPI00187BBF6A|nr:triose-phosphate isomerase [Sneathiella sp. P13V-1]MBE7637550.1 triose-phosphate isomerase [Sneathiella sp. P13V-1]